MILNKEVQPPKAKKIPAELEIHGDIRIDNYYWMNDREDPEVIAYLNAENDYKDKHYHVRTGFHGATDLSPVCLGAAIHFDTWVPNFGIHGSP